MEYVHTNIQSTTGHFSKFFVNQRPAMFSHFFNINGNFRILKWRYCIRPYFVLICSYFLKPSPKCGTEVRDMPCHLERSPGGGVQATWPIQNKPKRQRSMSPGFN
jgi:hypothetical protein